MRSSMRTGFVKPASNRSNVSGMYSAEIRTTLISGNFARTQRARSRPSTPPGIRISVSISPTVSRLVNNVIASWASAASTTVYPASRSSSARCSRMSTSSSTTSIERCARISPFPAGTGSIGGLLFTCAQLIQARHLGSQRISSNYPGLLQDARLRLPAYLAKKFDCERNLIRSPALYRLGLSRTNQWRGAFHRDRTASSCLKTI